MTQWVKVHAAKSDDLSSGSIPGTHMMEKTDSYRQVPYHDTQFIKCLNISLATG